MEGGEYGPALVAFTGGTAFNNVVQELMELTSRVTHVLPVSDNGVAVQVDSALTAVDPTLAFST